MLTQKYERIGPGPIQNDGDNISFQNIRKAALANAHIKAMIKTLYAYYTMFVAIL